MSKVIQVKACPLPYSPFQLPDLLVKPDLVCSSEHSETPYFPCPAWQHKAQRTYIVRSPIDLELSLTPNGSISSSTLTQDQFNRHIVLGSKWRGPNHAVVQIWGIMSWAFLTKEKNVWIHQHSDPFTSANNNFTCVEGWFNSGSWNRPINGSLIFHDLEKPVIISRGDPIYRVSFYSKNLDDRFSLTLGTLPPEEYRQMDERVSSVPWFRNKGFFKDLIFQESKPKSKCPFAFLWQK